MAEILIVGLGNTLQGYDAIGIRTVQRLQERYELSDAVSVLNGGTRGTALLRYLEGVKKLLAVDAIAFSEVMGP